MDYEETISTSIEYAKIVSRKILNLSFIKGLINLLTIYLLIEIYLNIIHL